MAGHYSSFYLLRVNFSELKSVFPSEAEVSLLNFFLNKLYSP